MKVVINKSYGGFGLSHDAVMLYAKNKGITLYCDDSESWLTYYLCPVEEYKKIEREEQLKPVGPNRYEKTNAMSFSYRDIPRNDPVLVEVVEQLGVNANGKYASLKVVNIPDSVAYEISEYDGMEHIAEVHRTWD
jgi:hypothetical protein